MDWQQHSDFLHAWPELHSLLAAYIALEEEDEQDAVRQFISENPQAIGRVVLQLNQLIEANNSTLCQQAAGLAGKAGDGQAWLHAILKTLKREV